MRPLRIAQLLSTGLANGAARHCVRLSEELARRGHDVLLVTKGGLDLTDAKAAGVTTAEASFARNLTEIAHVRRLLKDHGTEVAHTHMSSAHAMGAILRLTGGPPIVATAHARHLQLHWCVNDLVIAFTERTAAYHHRINWVPRKRLAVIPLFLGMQWSDPPTTEQRAKARAKLGIAQDALAIGQVGDVNFDKRQSDMIQAARGVLERRPEAVVVLKGTFYEPTEVRRVKRAWRGIEDRIVRFDRAGDIRDVLHALDIFVVSSRTEEGPITAVEAMAAGLPVVATRVGRMESLLETSGAGLLVRPGDVRGMAAALGTLAEDAGLRRRMGAAAARRAGEERDVGEMIGRVEAALAGVVGR